jgi:hypothetical protein
LFHFNPIHNKLFSNEQPDSTQKKRPLITAEAHAVTQFTVDDSSRMIHAKTVKRKKFTLEQATKNQMWRRGIALLFL